MKDNYIGPFKKTRSKMHEIIFEADTKAGKLFDIVLLWLILLSVCSNARKCRGVPLNTAIIFLFLNGSLPACLLWNTFLDHQRKKTFEVHF